MKLIFISRIFSDAASQDFMRDVLSGRQSGEQRMNLFCNPKKF